MAFIAKNPANSLYSNTILELRLSQNLTQEQFASRCGVSRLIISRVENGHPIGIKAASQIANAFGRHLGDLFLGGPQTSVHWVPPGTRLSPISDLVRSKPQIREISLALNPHTDRPAIAYLYYSLDDWNSDCLCYARQEADGSWATGIITKRANRPSADASIAFDSTGRLCALFKPRVEARELYYGYREDDDKWCFAQVALGHTAQPYAASFRLDKQDHPRIVYIQPTTEPPRPIMEHLTFPVQTGTLCYMRYDGHVWHSEPIDSDSNDLSYVQPHYGFQLDRQGRPCIAYVNFGRGGNPDRLKLARYSNDGWQAETILERQQLPGIVGEEPVFFTSIHAVRLLLDSQDRPHLFYLIDLPPVVLLHTHLSNTGWDTERISTPWQAGGPLECTFDPYDNIHIVVWSLQHDEQGAMHHSSAAEKSCNHIGHIWHIRKTQGWVIEEIAEEPYGTELALALDNTGRLHLAYYAASRGELWYATCQDSHKWTLTQIDGRTDENHHQ